MKRSQQYLMGLWGDLLDVGYISASPGVADRFTMRYAPRADNDPVLSQQPWYHKDNLFATSDQTNYVSKKVKKIQEGA